ncbi:unnamed protein product [Rotaria sp. Silwood1]|nr:unnamed protein product [Rotaria sp. Silwood1]CAF4004357.1 unnamed protein product [Rotaria sp. Silwood1]CAF4995978.1 unnamed protein product [Rotaria sp. Silwood1]CAF5036457.1 unnamed protein product [Rotaria sp. Silwood1]
MATTDDHKEIVQLLTEKQLVDEEEAQQEIEERKLQNAIKKIKREAEEIELIEETKHRDEIEKIKHEAEEIELIEETKHRDEIEKMKREGEGMKQTQEAIFRHSIKKMKRETKVIIQIEKTKSRHAIERMKRETQVITRIEEAKRQQIRETHEAKRQQIRETHEAKRQQIRETHEAKRQQIRETHEAKRRKLELEYASLSTKKGFYMFTSDYDFYDIDVPGYLQSFDINIVLKDNNYNNDNILNHVEHYSNQFSSYPELNEKQIQDKFDDLIVNLLNTLNNSTQLKYIHTSSSYYLKNKFHPDCTFIYKNINIDIDKEVECLQDFVVCLGNIKSPNVSLSEDSIIEEILQYLKIILAVQGREKIYGFLSNCTHIKFFYVKKKSDSNSYEFFQSQQLEMFTYSSEALSSIDTSTITTTENTRKLGVNKNTWKIVTNFLTMNIDFYQYTRLNIDPNNDLLRDRYMITKKLGIGVSSMVYLLEKNEDNHSVEDSPHYVMKILKESKYSECFLNEVEMAKKLKRFNDLNKFHLFFQDILYPLSSGKAFVF